MISYRLVVLMTGMLILTLSAPAANAIILETTHVKADPPAVGGTLTVQVTGANQNQSYNSIQIECKMGDTRAMFTVPAAAWSPAPVGNFMIIKGTNPRQTYHCVFVRSSQTISNQTFMITYTGAARGRRGDAGVGVGTTPKIYSSGTVQSTLASVRVPAVSEWGLFAMLLLVLTAGTVLLMRRRNATAV